MVTIPAIYFTTRKLCTSCGHPKYTAEELRRYWNENDGRAQRTRIPDARWARAICWSLGKCSNDPGFLGVA